MKSKQYGKIGIAGMGLLAVFMLIGIIGVTKYNHLQTFDEKVTAAWSEVVNQYQRRADLVPNLVEVTKGYAKHEESVFIEVTEARSRVGNINIGVGDLNAQTLKQFQQAQGELTSALSRLIAVSESYPDLKASEVFQNLQVQLEGTENRIATARNRYIESVQQFNTSVRQFPSNIIAGFVGLSNKVNFGVEDETAIAAPPRVNFGD